MVQWAIYKQFCWFMQGTHLVGTSHTHGNGYDYLPDERHSVDLGKVRACHVGVHRSDAHLVAFADATRTDIRGGGVNADNLFALADDWDLQDLQGRLGWHDRLAHPHGRSDLRNCVHRDR